MRSVESKSLRPPLGRRRSRVKPRSERSWDTITVGDHDGTWFMLLDGVGSGAARLPSGEVVRRSEPEPVELCAK